MGDHTETVQVDYDPAQISYDQLLDLFWTTHNPARKARSTQYRNAVFFHDQTQEQLALASKARLEKKRGLRVETRILPLVTFTPAEPYHQKNLLKTRDIVKEMTRIYPLKEAFNNSTAVARLNGYAGGYGTRKQLLAEIDRLGLSDTGKKKLLKMVRAR